jgi:DNA-binding protein
MFCRAVSLQRLLGEHDEVHLSALGMAVSTMVSIAEILKKDGLAVESRKQARA